MSVAATLVRWLTWPWRAVRTTWAWLKRTFLAAGPVLVKERHGYVFWGPVVIAILAVELLGALSESFENAIPWPTISSTVGHLEDRWAEVGVVVVAVLAVVIYQALTPSGRTARGRTIRTGAPRVRPVPRIYDWPLVYAMVLAAGVAAVATPLSTFQRGYVIYGTLLLLGIVVPSILAYWVARSVRFPTLFATARYVSRRLHWVAALLAAGLAVLVFHLALYPWPDLARESAEYAGLTASDARERAVDEVRRLNPDTTLTYRSASRGSFDDRDAWIVSFETARGFGAGCVVAVRKDSVTATTDCSR